MGRIFISYSKEDEKFKQQLLEHLKTGIGSEYSFDLVWGDHDVGFGDGLEQKIEEAIRSADVFLLLLSPNFFSSRWCYRVELPAILERHRLERTPVVPISIHQRRADVGRIARKVLSSFLYDLGPVLGLSFRSSDLDSDKFWEPLIEKLRPIIRSHFTSSKSEKHLSETDTHLDRSPFEVERQRVLERMRKRPPTAAEEEIKARFLRNLNGDSL